MAKRTRYVRSSPIELDDEDWNDEIEQDISRINYDGVVVFGRDWTVDTICNQVLKGNIDLDPAFQRRNAWDDRKRSLFIESLIVGVPVPQILLAETKKGSFVVIDGKQRLSTLLGYLYPDKFAIWDRPKLQTLKVSRELNGKSFVDMEDDAAIRSVHDRLLNADIRCTVISGFRDDDILYDIFYRLNSGSVLLSTQELRQSLIKGPFTQFLIDQTNTDGSQLQKLLRIHGPDRRFRDAELLLRFVALQEFADRYEGNLKKFLDLTLRALNKNWPAYSPSIQEKARLMEHTVERLELVFGEINRVGRKYKGGQWEGRFNKILFEVESYFFAAIPEQKINATRNKEFVHEFEELCDESEDFISSIESTTKSRTNYSVRFEHFARLVEGAYGVEIAHPFV